MVETAVRPRPGFGTFLLSDANTSGDGLSFHEYKKLLRVNKVKLLQERRATAYVPGNKRPAGGEKGAHVLKKPPRTSNANTQTSGLQADNQPAPRRKITIVVPQSTKAVGTATQTTKVQQRLVKSATSRSRQPTWSEYSRQSLAQTSRPRTAGGEDMRSSRAGEQSRELTCVAQEKDSASEKVQRRPSLIREGGQPVVEDIEEAQLVSRPSSRLGNEPASNHVDGGELSREELIRSYCWSTSTQRAYKEISWENKLPPGPPPPPVSTLNNLPDPVSLRFTMKRNELVPHNWQERRETLPSLLSATPHSCSPSKNTQQLPGYLGCMGRFDHPEETNPGCLQVKSTQPRPTKVTWRPNIPGYTGIAHWSSHQPVHVVQPVYHRPTSVSVHRSISCEEDVSPFIRTSPLSKMITLRAPYNPFNKVAA